MNSSQRRDRWTIILLVIIVAMGIEIVYLMYQNRKLKAILEDPKQYFQTLAADDNVPSISAYDIDGNDVSLRYSAHAPHTVLFWFAPTCSSCEDNVAFWNRLYAEHSSENFRFLGMCAGQPDEAEAYVAQHEIEFPVMCVMDPYLMESYRGNVLPQTVLISPTGSVIAAWPGALDSAGRAEVSARLAEP